MTTTLTNYEIRGLDRLITALDALPDPVDHTRDVIDSMHRMPSPSRTVDLVELERAEFDRANLPDRFE